VFLDLNVDRIAAELELVSHGMERGSQNRPPSDARMMDDVERQIVERIEAHKQDSNTIYLDHLHTYDERVTALSFEERFATIQQAAPKPWAISRPKRPLAGMSYSPFAAD
jgi:hypothetical protein